MSCKKELYTLFLLTVLLGFYTSLQAQNAISCEQAAQFLPNIERKADKITTSDPERITLHYLFVNEMMEQLREYDSIYLPNLHLCEEIDFYETKHQYQRLQQRLERLKDTLEIQKQRVDTIFYLQAVDELHHFDTNLAEYFLDRSLEFNRLNTDALIMKARILFAAGDYDECIERIHTLYNEAPLSREHENELSDFTAAFYDKLFTTGDSLVKAGHEADALPVFLTLESFCHDMPSSYCNDDYYHGIIRSKTGVYESYLTIAKVAWKKRNYEMTYKFLDYATEYFEANADMIEPSEEFVQFKELVERERSILLPEPAIEPEPSSAIQEMTITSLDTVQSDTLLVTLPEPIPYDSLQHSKYQQLLTDALYCLYLKDKKTAKAKLKEAIDSEACQCFPADARVRLVYEKISTNFFSRIFKR